MSEYAFEAVLQPDGSYIMSISGKQYRCRDWDDVCRKYREHTKGEKNGSKEGITFVPEHV